TVGEGIRQLAAAARVEAQRPRPHRNAIGHRRRVEIAPGVLKDGQRSVGLSAHYAAAERVPALAIRSTRDGVEGEPAQLDGAGPGCHQVGKYFDLESLSIGGRLEPRAGEAVLVEIGPCGWWRC